MRAKTATMSSRISLNESSLQMSLGDLRTRWNRPRHFMLLISLLAETSAYSSSSGESRYFQTRLTLPPLERSDDILPMLEFGDDFGVSSLPVLYTNDPKVATRWLEEHVAVEGCTLGFDVESVPNVPWLRGRTNFQGPATVQLATADSALVVHLARRNGHPSRSCVPLLEAVMRDERIIKAGVKIDDDMVELRCNFPGLEAKSRLDLASLGEPHSNTLGLKKLCKYMLGLELPKPKRLARSDWSAVPLSNKQIEYSARDAWVAAAIVDRLESLDPESFHPVALMERLRPQRSLKELHQRRHVRRNAKQLLSALLSAPNKGQPSFDRLPAWKRTIVRELKRMIKENGSEMEFIDVKLLEVPKSVTYNGTII